ncbi:MAG: protein translocase subunit SecD [Acidimicrobiia bacterium]|nr:protein translocase subunit SecD [Acidimicrobiia bacterium]
MSRRGALITLLVTVVVAWGSLIVTQALGTTPRLGLDLQGGLSVLLEAPPGTDPEVLDKAVEIMRRRVEALGRVQEPEIAVTGLRSIEVQLPGVTDPDRALEAVGTIGQLAFRPVIEVSQFGASPLLLDAIEYEQSTTTTTTTSTTVPGETTTTTGTDGATTTTAAGETTTTSAVETTTTTAAPEPPDLTPVLPPGISICDPAQDLVLQPGCVDGTTAITLSDDPTKEAWLGDPDTGEVFHLAPARVLGSDLADAEAGFIQQGASGTGVPFGVSTGGVGQWVVMLDFNAEGAIKFQDVTKELASYSLGDPRRRFAIVLDAVVQSAPQMDEEVSAEEGIAGGRAVITMGTAGNPEQAARDLAVVLRYGALPVVFSQPTVESISATLGSDSLRAGLIAGLGGLALVALALLLYYRALGLIAVVGLTVFGSLVLTVFALLGRYQGVSLTLAGVAGIIVSIGITSDSYIVYYERIKEEVRAGRSMRAAVDHAFRRAFRTMLTADTVSLAAAILLFILAVGSVKGFALALGIATVTDLVVAFFFTRPAVALAGFTRWGEGGRFSIRGAAGVAKEAIVLPGEAGK